MKKMHTALIKEQNERIESENQKDRCLNELEQVRRKMQRR